MTSNCKSDLAANLIGLCAKQLDLAMQDATSDIACLTRHLLNTATAANSLQREVRSANAERNNAAVAEITANIVDFANQAASVLQYEDRMRQRLENIGRILERLIEPTRYCGSSDEQWRDILRSIRSEYTSEIEREMFDQALAGNAHALLNTTEAIADDRQQ